MESADVHVPTYLECFAGLAVGLAVFFLLLGVAAVFGANTITSGGHYVHGPAALIVAIVLDLVFAAVFAGLQKLGFALLGVIRRTRATAAN